MAKEDQSLRGKIGPLVVYRLNGQDVVCSLPLFYKQMPATKARSLNFGKAARAAAMFRSGLKNVLPFPKDYGIQGRLAGAISKWLRTTPIAELPPKKYLISWISVSTASRNPIACG